MISCAVCIPNWPNKVSIYDPAGVPPFLLSCLIEGSYCNEAGSTISSNIHISKCQTSVSFVSPISTPILDNRNLNYPLHRFVCLFSPQGTLVRYSHSFYPRIHNNETKLDYVADTVFEMQSFFILHFSRRVSSRAAATCSFQFVLCRYVLHSNICSTGRFSSWVI